MKTVYHADADGWTDEGPKINSKDDICAGIAASVAGDATKRARMVGKGRP
jgi:hypothetical protein